MRVHRTSIVTATAASLVLAAGASGASATGVDATAGAQDEVEVTASVLMPVSVSEASVALRPTRVGPYQDEGRTETTPGIAAGTAVEFTLVLKAQAAAGASVDVSISDPDDAVSVDVYGDREGRTCIGVGVDFQADVAAHTAAGAAADTTVTADAAVTVDGTPVIAESADAVLLQAGQGGAVQESVPVQTGADVCLPAVHAGLEAELRAAVEAAVEAAVVAAG